ncbi:MAG: F0F1 ATP synthase subunit A, partial [Leptonema sp. (in: Bacteria)]|nr:F0F1 ATP synthase subunit A [Leptonema sp. (in: bacteria)]
VPGGVPFWLFPLMWPIEFIVGPLAKGFALMIRLMANMTAGHVLILVLVGFIFQVGQAWIVPISVFGMGAIYVLEILVAVLQAFIFALLSSIFIGLMMHRH